MTKEKNFVRLERRRKMFNSKLVLHASCNAFYSTRVECSTSKNQFSVQTSPTDSSWFPLSYHPLVKLIKMLKNSSLCQQLFHTNHYCLKSHESSYPLMRRKSVRRWLNELRSCTILRLMTLSVLYGKVFCTIDLRSDEDKQSSITNVIRTSN